MTLKIDAQGFRTLGSSIEVKASREGKIEGYASTFNDKADLHGEIVRPGAFGESLVAHKAQGSRPVMLWSHRMEAPIGRWDDLTEDSNGLFVRGQINLKTELGREAYEHISAGDVTGLSIGFAVPKGGRAYIGNGIHELTRVDLMEVSVVPVPANSSARILAVKSMLGSRSEAVELLRKAGLPKEAARKFAAGGWPALAGKEDPQLSQLAAVFDAAIGKVKGL